MTSRSKQFLWRTERITQVKKMKSKNLVIQENSELLKKSEVSVSDFTEDVHELTANKLRSDENSILQMFNEKDENKTEVHKTQIISYKINEQICESEEVVHKIKYISQKNKESFHDVVDTLIKTLKFRKFSENTAICELRLKIQLTEQEHLNLQFCIWIKHNHSESMNLKIDCKVKQTQSVKILLNVNLYKNSIYSHYCDFCHQINIDMKNMLKKTQYSEMIHYLHYFIINWWKIYCKEKELTEKWEFLKKFLNDLLEDQMNWIYNVWMKWLWMNKKNEKSDKKYLCHYNKL